MSTGRSARATTATIYWRRPTSGGSSTGGAGTDGSGTDEYGAGDYDSGGISINLRSRTRAADLWSERAHERAPVSARHSARDFPRAEPYI